MSKWSIIFFTEKVNTREDSFKYWKWAFILLFSHSHLETGILLFGGFLESLHPQRLNELEANVSHNFSLMYYQATAGKLCFKSPLEIS